MQRQESTEQIKGLPWKQIKDFSKEERQFAQQQFRALYTEEMSKANSELNHLKKIQENIQVIETQEQRHIKQQQLWLKKKMAAIEDKRTKNMEEKRKHYHQNDERWSKKLQEIQAKLKKKNQEALDKAQKYRDQSEKFWKQKQKKSVNQDKGYHFTHMRTHEINTIPVSNQTKNHEQPRSQSFQYSHEAEKKKSRIHKNYSKPQIEQEPSIHQQKSLNIQRKKQEFIFQRAMSKLAKIERKKSERQKKYQPKSVEPTIPRKATEKELIERKRKRRFPQNHSQLIKSQSKRSLQKLIKEHVEVKNKLEQEKFLERGKLVEQNQKRTRKDKIIKMVRQRVQQMKINTLKKENSQKNMILS